MKITVELIREEGKERIMDCFSEGSSDELFAGLQAAMLNVINGLQYDTGKHSLKDEVSCFTSVSPK